MNKKVLIIFMLLSMTAKSQDGVFGSFYDSPVVTRQGVRLLQEMNANGQGNGRFFWVPSRYTLRNSLDDSAHVSPMYRHSIVRVEGKEVSVYEFELRPSSLSDIQKSNLERGLSGAIVGRAPVCGTSLNIPGYLAVSESVNSGIRAFVSIPVESTLNCMNGAPLVDRLTLRLEVPMNQEPNVARSLMGDVGLILPEVVWHLPMRYYDRASITIDYERTYDALSRVLGGGLSVPILSTQVEHRVREIVAGNSLAVQVNIDVQTPGGAERIREFAVQTVLTQFLHLIPQGIPGLEETRHNPGLSLVTLNNGSLSVDGTQSTPSTTRRRVQPTLNTSSIPVAGAQDPLPEGTNNRGVQPRMISQQGGAGMSALVPSSGRQGGTPVSVGVGFNFDDVEARSKGTETFRYEQANYSWMRAEVPIRIRNLSSERLAPTLRELVNR